MGGGGGGGGAAAAAPEPVKEKEAFDIKLTEVDAKSKIKIIKEVRAITGLGLKEVSLLVILILRSTDAPCFHNDKKLNVILFFYRLRIW